MKRNLLCLITAMAAAIPPAWAQESSSGVMPIVTGATGTGGRLYAGGPGTYQQIEENVSAIAQDAIASARLTQAEDRDFVLGATAEIHQAFVEYSESAISEKLLAMNARGIRGETTPLDEFLQATADLKVKKMAFESLLQKYGSINKETLPTNYTLNQSIDSENTITVPVVADVDLKKLVAYYMSFVDTRIAPQVASYKSIKVDINKEPIGISIYKDIMNPDFSSLPEFSVSKREELTTEMKKLRQQSRDAARNERIAFTDQFRDLYNTFFRKYGADYRYIYRQDENEDNGLFGWLFGNSESQTRTGKGNTIGLDGLEVDDDIAQRNATYSHLIDILWMRSYTRLVSGVQICAPQPKSVAQTNLKGFQSLGEMMELRTEPACSVPELEEALENVRRILISSGIQSDYVFDKSSGFLDAGLLNKLGSAVTFVKGKRSSAEALHMLAQLIYADIQEDLIMARPGRGLTELRSMYAARYQNTDEKKETYSALRCAIDYDATTCGELDAYSVDSGVGMDGDFKALFADLRDANANALDYIDQAERLQQMLDAARSNSRLHRASESRRNDL